VLIDHEVVSTVTCSTVDFETTNALLDTLAQSRKKTTDISSVAESVQKVASIQLKELSRDPISKDFAAVDPLALPLLLHTRETAHQKNKTTRRTQSQQNFKRACNSPMEGDRWSSRRSGHTPRPAVGIFFARGNLVSDRN